MGTNVEFSITSPSMGKILMRSEDRGSATTHKKRIRRNVGGRAWGQPLIQTKARKLHGSAAGMRTAVRAKVPRASIVWHQRNHCCVKSIFNFIFHKKSWKFALNHDFICDRPPLQEIKYPSIQINWAILKCLRDHAEYQMILRTLGIQREWIKSLLDTVGCG